MQSETKTETSFTSCLRMYFCEADNTFAMQDACVSVPGKPSIFALAGCT